MISPRSRRYLLLRGALADADLDPVIAEYEQDIILLGDFNLPPSDSGMIEVDATIDPVFTGDARTTISERWLSL